MQRLIFTVRFITPAFLGDSEQDGRWRTPPFKALLRQWWRVAYGGTGQGSGVGEAWGRGAWVGSIRAHRLRFSTSPSPLTR